MDLMSSQFNYFNSKLDSVLNKMITLKAENSKTTLENIKIDSEIDTLKIKLDELEKHSIEIKCLPKSLN